MEDIKFKDSKKTFKQLKSLIGSWQCESQSQMGKVKCTRIFNEILSNKYIELNCIWDFGSKQYIEKAVFGFLKEELCFWSFTNDGKNSFGKLSKAEDIHENAICFEAEMPAGTARMVYWFEKKDELNWVVESKTKKGWNRFVHHVYYPI